MHLTPVIGLLGDSATFAGGLVLALDAARKEREFTRIKKVAAGIKSPFLAHVKFQTKGGLTLADENDVERVFIHDSARQAVWGCWLLAGGFLLLLGTRLAELCK